MAVTVVASGGYGPSCTWQVDYDSTSKTVGLTVSAASVTAFFVEVTLTNGTTFVLDCVNGQAGNLVNQGRVVLVGPGSVLGHTAPVNSLNWQTDLLYVGTRWTP